MKIEVIERKKNENIDMVRFIVDGISIELANAFRRIVLTEVPSMAITEVLFVENDGVLYDEMVAHRLGLIPLTTDLKNYNLPDECVCGGQGCTLCQAQFMLEIHAENEPKSVYSRDLECLDPKVQPVSPDILIAQLGDKSSLVFEAYAQLGQGKNHAKYQSVSSIGYKYFPKMMLDQSKLGMIDGKQDKAKLKSEIAEIVQKCHAKLYSADGDKLVVRDDWWKDCSLCGACERYSSPGAIRISGEPNKFIFNVEGTGALDLKEIFTKAVEIFLEKIKESTEKANKIKILPKPIVKKR